MVFLHTWGLVPDGCLSLYTSVLAALEASDVILE